MLEKFRADHKERSDQLQEVPHRNKVSPLHRFKVISLGPPQPIELQRMLLLIPYDELCP